MRDGPQNPGILSAHSGFCRMGVAGRIPDENGRFHREVCGKPVVAALRRSNGWWCYCEEHLYGGRLNNGVVEHKLIIF